MSQTAHTFTGREWDKETGLYYYRARYYDPMEGRFISKDPISSAGGDVNLYGYVQNNPVSFRDPLGLERQPVQTDPAWDSTNPTPGDKSYYITHPVGPTNPDYLPDPASTVGTAAIFNILEKSKNTLLRCSGKVLGIITNFLDPFPNDAY